MKWITAETEADKDLPAGQRGTVVDNDPISILMDDGYHFDLNISKPNEPIGRRVVIRERESQWSN
jgi:hypothetical protein